MTNDSEVLLSCIFKLNIQLQTFIYRMLSLDNIQYLIKIYNVI